MSARAGSSVVGWAWGAAGAAGAVLVAVAGPRLVDGGVITWWFHPALSGDGAHAMLYAGLILISVAWLGLGTGLRALSTTQLWLIGALWTLPLLAGPALFSRDVYSYLAQGELLHLGLDPYRDLPVVLAQHGQAHLLAAVSPFWRHTTAPYGPLFLGLVSLISSFAGSHLVAAALCVKLLELVSLVLLGIFVPRLASLLGADPKRAAWLAVLSPLMLFEVVAAGHNDGLMAGLMVAGVVLALEHRPLAGIAVCALATTIKIPAAAAIVLIAVAAARQQPTQAAARKLFAQAALAAVAVIALVSAATTVGIQWLSTGTFSTPQRVHLAITPATGIGYTLASLLHDLGIVAHAHSIESVCGYIAGALTVGLAVVLVWLTEDNRMLVRNLAILLLAAAVGGPAAWPWYLIWGLVVLAACPGPQRSRWFAVAVVVPAFLIRANGLALPPRTWSPLVVVLYALIVAAAVRSWRRGGGALPSIGRRPGGVPRPEPST